MDTIDFNRISNLPNTLVTHGTTDAYTKSEVDQKATNVAVNNVYIKDEIDLMFANFVADDDIPKQKLTCFWSQLK